MSDIMQQALQARTGQAPDWLQTQHEEGRSSWQRASFPDRKTEQWKYTNLRVLKQGGYLSAASAIPSVADKDDIEQSYRIPGFESVRLVFINGSFVPDLSDNGLPEGLELVRFSAANDEQIKQIKTHLGTVINRDQHLFAALNDSWLNDGVFLHVDRDVRLETPIQIVWMTTRQTQEFSLAQRLLVVLEPGSQATLIEQFSSDNGEQNCFTTGISELILAANARLQHYRLQLEEEHALHIGGVHASLERDANLQSFHLALGSSLKRIEIVINYRGEGAHCQLDGVYLPRRNQHVDFHTNIEHAVPNCTTDETFRGIIGDSGRGVFNGRIHIHPDAQKCSARLSNKNLLTSNQAEVNTKPELEIYADDVKCAHGATVAQLDEQLMYYLRTRGISRKEAEVMLSFGFINEMLNTLPHTAIADHLRPMLAKLFANDPSLMRHIT